MDIRKQKRLGPAPIASFEKSFEDTTPLPGAIVPAVGAATPADPSTGTSTQTENADIHNNANDLPPPPATQVPEDNHWKYGATTASPSGQPGNEIKELIGNAKQGMVSSIAVA